MSVLLVFEICELFLQVGHFIQTLHPPPLTVFLIHFWNMTKTHTSMLGIMSCDGKRNLLRS